VKQQGNAYRCKPCERVLTGSALASNRWGDPSCPVCGGVDLVPHRTRLASAIAAYFTYSVF